MSPYREPGERPIEPKEAPLRLFPRWLPHVLGLHGLILAEGIAAEWHARTMYPCFTLSVMGAIAFGGLVTLIHLFHRI